MENNDVQDAYHIISLLWPIFLLARGTSAHFQMASKINLRQALRVTNRLKCLLFWWLSPVEPCILVVSRKPIHFWRSTQSLYTQPPRYAYRPNYGSNNCDSSSSMSSMQRAWLKKSMALVSQLFYTHMYVMSHLARYVYNYSMCICIQKYVWVNIRPGMCMRTF